MKILYCFITPSFAFVNAAFATDISRVVGPVLDYYPGDRFTNVYFSINQIIGKQNSNKFCGTNTERTRLVCSLKFNGDTNFEKECLKNLATSYYTTQNVEIIVGEGFQVYSCMLKDTP